MKRKVSWVEPTDVYVIRAQDGTVLYVGFSGNLRQRLAHHRATKDWWSPANTVEVETLPDRKAARDREAVLIDELKPLHNKINHDIWWHRRDEILALQAQGLTLKQIRERSGAPIEKVAQLIYRGPDQSLLPEDQPPVPEWWIRMYG